MSDEATILPAKPSRRAPADRRPASVTVVDVARLAGVSAITVSRALNTPEQVSPGTLERVREAVRQTGYVPNLLAGGLRSNKSRLVAAVVPTIAGPVFMETIQALTEALAEKGYQLILGQSGYTDSREDALLDALIGRRPDGIVLTGILHSPQGRRRLIASGIPVVETWDLSDDPIDMLVGFSHEEIGAAVCRFLHGRGRRRPVLLSGDDARARRRNAGFVKAARELGMDWDAHHGVPTRLVPAPTTLASGRSGTSALLQAHPGFDAVFCSSDLLALGVLTEAQARGLAVPRDFAVMGFGDQHYAAALHPALTTVRIDGNAMGRTAARFIVERAEGRAVEERIVDIGFSMVERDSA
ncbi:LacI family DNA-binding transcriptional regulator [Caldimonas tepidiphila]|uniref:LacI family DNA-binding transcriptional regulator n=1 Tax=Caldimonas tepidiphila TaxID=2315841 RepID=UPI000E5A2286|nr:LacI family DNA-binding transcriptional regulator [Caldimonas tepidiphila]